MATKTYKAAIYKGIDSVEIQGFSYPECGPDDVIVKNLKAGICGSDVGAMTAGGDASMIWKDHEFGHEMVSEVVEKGANVKDINIGDHVFPNMGKAKRDHSRMATVGGFSEFIHIPQFELGFSAFKIDNDMPTKVAVLLEPFIVGYKGAKNVEPKLNETAIVFGAGIIGMSAAIGFKYLGLEKVMIVDISEYRLANAEKFGLISCNPAKEDFRDKAIEVFGEKTGYGGAASAADCYVDALGIAAAIDMFTEVAAPRARLAIVGVHHQPITFTNPLKLCYGNWSIKGCGSETYEMIHPEVLELFSSGKFDLAQLVSHEFSLDNIYDALKTAANPDLAQKVVIDYEG